jgi:transcription termination factor Rho
MWGYRKSTRQGRFRASIIPVETMELLLDKLGKTRSNAEFLGSMSG